MFFFSFFKNHLTQAHISYYYHCVWFSWKYFGEHVFFLLHFITVTVNPCWIHMGMWMKWRKIKHIHTWTRKKKRIAYSAYLLRLSNVKFIKAKAIIYSNLLHNYYFVSDMHATYNNPFFFFICNVLLSLILFLSTDSILP